MESSGETEENKISSLMRKSKILAQFLIEHEEDEYAPPPPPLSPP